MKLKHNKKRNTAFLYESLIRELTRAVVEKNESLKEEVISLIKENFKGNSILAKELRLYKALNESGNLDLYTAERLISEIRKEYHNLDREKIFESQSKLINKVNKRISSKVFSNFVPNYRSLATISQIFNDSLEAKERVLLERKVIGSLVSKHELKDKSKNMMPIDKLVYKTFVEKFNSKYGENLLEEQQKLLNAFLMDFERNGLEFKFLVNEEVGRLKRAISDMMRAEEIMSDPLMLEKAERVFKKLENYKTKIIDQKMISEVLKIQELVRESTSSVN